MNVVDFSTAKISNKRPTHLSDGLLVTGELKGKHLHQAFGTENYANLNIGQAQIFAATDRYYGKPMVGINMLSLLAVMQG
jgi:hypothetical protein